MLENLKKQVVECLQSADYVCGFVSAIVDFNNGNANVRYSMAGPGEGNYLQPSEFFAWAQIPALFQNRDAAAEAVFLLLADAYAEVNAELRNPSEDSLRKEMRHVRELAVEAARRGSQAEEYWFDDRLLAVKSRIAVLAEQRQERIQEKSMSGMGF